MELQGDNLHERVAQPFQQEGKEYFGTKEVSMRQNCSTLVHNQLTVAGLFQGS